MLVTKKCNETAVQSLLNIMRYNFNHKLYRVTYRIGLKRTIYCTFGYFLIYASFSVHSQTISITAFCR